MEVKPFSFPLTKALITSKGILRRKQGFLIQLKSQSGHYGWGEVSPLNINDIDISKKILDSMGRNPSREILENRLHDYPGCIGFGIGSALAELDGLIGENGKMDWQIAPQSAFLLPQNQTLLTKVDELVKENSKSKDQLTLKWKIAIESNKKEKKILSSILKKLPKSARLRLDANAGLSRKEAQEWVDIFLEEPRLEWLEQPLSENDLTGLLKLSEQIPVALDESLLSSPSLRKDWKGWQIRRPLLDGDPRMLLRELNEGIGYRAISTSFETGIGRRWIHHLAALQSKGPTPTAPGLAPGWCPNGPLFSRNPKIVWEAA